MIVIVCQGNSISLYSC